MPPARYPLRGRVKAGPSGVSDGREGRGAGLSRAVTLTSVLPFRKPTPSTLKAGELRTHVSRCQVCMRRT